MAEGGAAFFSRALLAWHGAARRSSQWSEQATQVSADWFHVADDGDVRLCMVTAGVVSPCTRSHVSCDVGAQGIDDPVIAELRSQPVKLEQTAVSNYADILQMVGVYKKHLEILRSYTVIARRACEPAPTARSVCCAAVQGYEIVDFSPEVSELMKTFTDADLGCIDQGLLHTLAADLVNEEPHIVVHHYLLYHERVRPFQTEMELNRAVSACSRWLHFHCPLMFLARRSSIF